MSPNDDPIRQRILATVDSIPRGRVASYGQVALEAGLPGRARLVGRTLGQLPEGTKLAWHRVVNAAGRISVSGASAREQRRRLRAEGVTVDVRGRVRIAEFGWRT
jgi:methylated-DNA-protein-cysteine methyltransferase-like protein